MNVSLWILRWLRRGSLPVEIGRTFHFISDAVTIGLCLLWLSGLGFLALYAMESPEKFENPRLWANVIVVIVLTINGVIIRAFVLPETLPDLSRLLLFWGFPQESCLISCSRCGFGCVLVHSFCLRHFS